jgi:hypothetical protein
MAKNFRMTSYLQENVCFVGQKETFEEGSETLQKLMGIQISNKQIQRVSEHYGQSLEESIEQQVKEQPAHCITKQDPFQFIYAMNDGSMVLTREEKWKEIKLGRVFNAQDNLAITEKRKWIEKSKYCAYLGEHKTFLERMEPVGSGIGRPCGIPKQYKYSITSIVKNIYVNLPNLFLKINNSVSNG